MLEIQHLSKSFAGEFALKDVSFEVRLGEILGLIGPNGSGKTTLLETIAGFQPQDSGQIKWNGLELSLAKRKEILFYLPDGALPYPDQTVARVLHFFTKAFAAPLEQTLRVTHDLQLNDVLRKRVKELSKGFRKRLLLAIALVSPQPLLFLDEPFDGLDLRQTLAVMEILKGAKKAGRTLVLSIHQLNDAAKISDRLLLLSAGSVLTCGTKRELETKTNLAGSSVEEIFLALT